MSHSADTLLVATASTAETEAFGARLAAVLTAGDVLVLTGDLGAGKTHLSKGIARGLGIGGAVTSPTFNIALVYEGGRLTLNHLDLYRIERADQLEDIDYFGTIEAGGVTLVEWGDRFAEVLELADVTVTITATGDDARAIQLTPLSARGTAIIGALAGEGTRG